MQNTHYIRNDESRNQFVENHKLNPVFRRILKPVEQVRCVCKNPVEKEIYFIEATDKKTNETSNIFVGTSCGRKLLRQAGVSIPPLFTLFKSETNNSENDSKEKTSRSSEKDTLDFCILNQELYDAIGILCEAWNVAFPDGDLLKILLYLTKNPKIPTQDWAILKFNGMVGKDGEGRKLVQMLSDLRQSGKELKYFTFHNMNRIIDDSGYPNNVE